MEANYDFSGYATKHGIRCSDGRTIMKGAFKDNDGKKVPFVWQHMHNDPQNVLGHAILENRDDGVYAYIYLNDSEGAKAAKEMVRHGDLNAMSIYANQLQQRRGAVLHGDIKEVSLVMAPANPEALIDNVSIAHADGTYTDLDDEVVIYSDEFIEHGNKSEEDDSLEHADGEGKTVGEIFDSLTDEQKNVVYFMIGQALEDSGVEHSEEEGDDDMKFNPFEQGATENSPTLSHDELSTIFADAQRCGSLKESFLAHAQDYGISNIDLLFPDAKNVTNPPDWIKRDTDWVAGVLNGVTHTPFSRIKSMAADITADEARAKGYMKGNLKKEEVFSLLQRVTTPTTVYKKQKLDRDDIVDITDLNVVALIKQEMRLMLDEEIARAILVSDGRPAIKSDGKANEDKINEEHIRPIWKEAELYAIHKDITSDVVGTEAELEAILRAMEDYQGSGAPVMYTTQSKITDWLLLKDKNGRRLYETEAALASFIGVSRFVKVPVMKGLTRTTGEDKDAVTHTLLGIIVNLKDYKVGADKGGQVSMFDDFDIDYNQYKYLMETRISGCLVHPKSALVIESVPAATAG